MAVIFGGAFLLNLIAAYVLADVPAGLRRLASRGASPALSSASCWVATSFGVNYLFERRPLGLWLINGGYHVLQFTLYGIVFGLMGVASI